MNDTQHTPGPWNINPDFRQDMEQNFHIESPGGTVCFCSVGWPDDAIAEANAQLIAAAPELLAACEMCERIITEIKEVPGGWDSGANRQNLIASRHYIRDAIAKAVQS